MLEKRRRKRQLLKVRMIMVLLLASLIWAGISFGRGFLRAHNLRQDILTLENEIAAMELRNAELEKEIERVRSPEYVERVAREELGLVKPDETLYIISHPEQP